MNEAKQKAEELFEKYWQYKWQTHRTTKSFKIVAMSKSAAKWCAINTVNEMIDVIYEIPNNEKKYNFLQEVKKEIELL